MQLEPFGKFFLPRFPALARLSGVERILQALIRGYQITLSPIIGRQCRFEPSCSHYASEAIRVHGSAKGSYLAIKRILRCNPWGGHGWDPVPEKE